ncbi:MAG: 4-hydroxythreonine-4-phosphate dehydrogenase PdxA, partial [Deltaproteobacteria bacterium]|nr:4-hydroxythreonine-4-phosphate dehydrogenase PdxA [Deltaproteobacteria bacterium]
VLYGEERALRAIMAVLGDDRPLRCLSGPDEYQAGAINCVNIESLPGDYDFGRVQAACGKAAFDYLERAVRDAMAGRIAAVVTCPLNKAALNLAGLHYAGHTEILGELTGAPDQAMVLDGKGLRVIHVSTHVSLRQACDRATKDRILRTIRLGHETAKALAGTPNPRLVVAGLNPHNSEGGLFGWEEEREIIPAIQAAQAEGFSVTGPISPDTVFMRMLKGEFDMVVAMYHDQGHIPLKLIDFMGGVNITVGLPIIRTSVDHGTAFGRAGTGRADHGSLLAAIDAAYRLIAGRRAASPRYILVADDLTGANDTGVQLLNHGLAASVSIEDGASPPLSEIVVQTGAQALVFDTESRNIPAQDAARRVADLAGGLIRFAGQSVFYKKVDSTLRGNLAAEVQALADALGLRTVVFTSAFPRNGRVVRGDVLYVDDVPVAETAMARDPFKPVRTSSLTRIMAEAYPDAKSLLLPALRDPQALAAALAGEGCVCCDAESDADLLALVRGMLAIRPAQEVLWVGSAGLAGALLTAGGESTVPLPAPPGASSAAPVLLVLGSVQPKNREQARRVLSAGEAAPVFLDMQAFLADPEAESSRLLCACSELLASGRSVLLATAHSEDDIRLGSSEAVALLVAGVARKLLTAVPMRGLFVTGGDMAVRVLAALECRTARIEREVESGVPLVRLQGGVCPGLAVITKAGAFGNDETLRRCLAAL